MKSDNKAFNITMFILLGSLGLFAFIFGVLPVIIAIFGGDPGAMFLDHLF